MRFTEAVFLFTIMAAGQAAASGPAMVSAASGTAPVAPGSIVSIYGTDMADGTASAVALPLPTSLSDVVATIVDSTSVSTPLPLFFVSPGQINAMIPATVQSGLAQLSVMTPSGVVSAPVTIAAVAPGLFSANETGKDAAAAQFAINYSDGSQSLNNIFQCGAGAGTGSCVPLGLNLSAGPAALVLYGTGIRNAAALSAVTVTVGNQTLPATYAGPATGFEGLDQVNVLLPPSLAGTGIVNVSVSVAGTVSNVLTVSFGFATAASACAGCTQYTDPPYTFATQVSGACDVTSVAEASPGALYPPSSWPYTAGKTVYVQQATSANVDQLYIADVASDGTLQDQICLSCASPSAPPIDRYKNSPTLRPQGDWILMRVEGANGPVINQSSTTELQVIRNNGYYANLWVTNTDGSQWYQLTQFIAPPGGNPGAYGELGAQWSPDGTMVMFSETYAAPDQANLQGYWHLYIANFSVDSTTGVPSFSNVTDISLPGDVFYEPQSFSPDGTELIVQSYTPGMNAYGVDLYTVNLAPGAAFGQYTDITNSPYSWDEHAEFSPDGQKIAYISSLPFPNIIPQYGTLLWADFRTYLHNEMFLMSANGTDVQQLTYFNTPGSPEYTPQFGDAMYPRWNLAGTQLLVQNGTADDPVTGGNTTWTVNFQGACGAQASL
jgi:uncharacterized protein (TIGR03437 family)